MIPPHLPFTPHLLALAAAPSSTAWATLALHHPLAALATATLGTLLLLLEFQRPGWVLPAAAGVALLLAGAYGLTLRPLRPFPASLLLPAVALLLTPWRLPRFWAAAIPGTLLLAAALSFLPRDPVPLWRPLAALDGLLLGALIGTLCTIAGRARQAKSISPQPRSASRAAAERWH